MQYSVCHPAQLEPEVARAAPGSDDQEVGVPGGVHEDGPGRSFDRTPVCCDIGGNVVERRVQGLHRQLLVQSGGFTDRE